LRGCHTESERGFQFIKDGRPLFAIACEMEITSQALQILHVLIPFAHCS